MGHVAHEALIVTTWDQFLAGGAYARAVGRFGPAGVTPLFGSAVNGYWTFVILPSGSKLGWAEEAVHADQLAGFVQYLEGFKHEDGSGPFRYARVLYGDDFGRISCQTEYGATEVGF